MHPAVVVAFVVATACKQHDFCDEIVSDLTECYDDICDGSGAGSPFCKCWDQGEDLDMGDCTCEPVDFTVMCQYFEDLSAWEALWGQYDCHGLGDPWSDACTAE